MTHQPKQPRLLPSIRSLNRKQLTVVTAGIAAIGIGLVLLAHAAGPYLAIEPETGSLSGQAATGADASASGGQYLALGGPATPSPTPTPGCAAGVTGSAPACALAPPAAATGGKHWNVGFSEEFDGTAYDPAKLSPCFDWNYGDCTSTFNAGYEHYLPSQDTVSGGIGHLTAAPLSPPFASTACLGGSCIYKSGLLSTARKSANDPATAYLYKFTYGYVEASLKVVNQQGFFVAWWMLPADPNFNYHYNADGSYNPSGPWRYEIDILEMLGHDPTDMEMHYHWGDGSNDHYSPNESNPKNGACADLNYSQGFHRFGVDWEPTYVAFYIDGIKCGQHNATANAPVPNVPMQLILDQMVSNNWQRSVGKPLLDTSLTSDLQVDYMRVYQQVP